MLFELFLPYSGFRCEEIDSAESDINPLVRRRIEAGYDSIAVHGRHDVREGTQDYLEKSENLKRIVLAYKYVVLKSPRQGASGRESTIYRPAASPEIIMTLVPGNSQYNYSATDPPTVLVVQGGRG
jgi:hypothetical protein